MDNNQIQSTSELAVRREKLQNLVEAGKNPFEITKYDVTHLAPAAIKEFEERESTLAEGETITVGIYVKCAGPNAWGKIDDALLNSVKE